jgi:hypothetical protein
LIEKLRIFPKRITDDFYQEMKYIIEENNPESNMQSQDSRFWKSQSYSRSTWAEALVPINICQWPAFTTGSAAASDIPSLGEKIQTPIDNIIVIVAKEYLQTSQNDIQWRARA